MPRTHARNARRRARTLEIRWLSAGCCKLAKVPPEPSESRERSARACRELFANTARARALQSASRYATPSTSAPPSGQVKQASTYSCLRHAVVHAAHMHTTHSWRDRRGNENRVVRGALHSHTRTPTDTHTHMHSAIEIEAAASARALEPRAAACRRCVQKTEQALLPKHVAQHATPIIVYICLAAGCAGKCPLRYVLASIGHKYAGMNAAARSQISA